MISFILQQQKRKVFPIGTGMAFQFTLSEDTSTSAGVYDAADKLIRNLWGDELYEAGTHVAEWDGKDNLNNTVATGTHHVKVLSYNIDVNWNSARIGNTSTARNGDSIHYGHDDIDAFCIADNHIFYEIGYGEKDSTWYKTSLDNIGAKIRLAGQMEVSTMANCTDGINVYRGGYSNQPVSAGIVNSFVFATNAETNAFIIFANGDPHSSSGYEMPSVIDYQEVAAGSYSGEFSNIFSMACQITGNKLVVVRKNKIDILDKTGTLLNVIIVSGVAKVGFDQDDLLWLGLGSSVIKYTVNSDGTLTSTGISITGITSAAAFAVNNDNSIVYVADDAADQQVIKGFDNETGGSALWTLGTPGGYMTDSTGSNYKFYWRDLLSNYQTQIGFEPDGSFWVLDGANCRIIHYTSERVYIEQIMYQGTSYWVFPIVNEPSRIMCNLKEFEVNHALEMDNGLNGSWIFKRNWQGGFPDYIQWFGKPAMQNIVTIDGHTFCVGSHKTNGTYPVFEMVTGGTLRQTKVSFQVRAAIGPDGHKYYNPEGDAPGGVSNIYRYLYLGLDVDDDPLWDDDDDLVVQIPIINATIPNPTERFKYNMTSANKWIVFDNSHNVDSDGTDPHLGGIPEGETDFQFKTSYGTLRSYDGNFPPKGHFDNGNQVGGPGGGAGGFSTILNRFIVWSYHGEFWKSSQTNKFNLYYDNGLFLKQWGTVGTDFPNHENHYEGGAGNSLSGGWSQFSEDVAYLYTGDEGKNTGVQSWKVEGLTTVSIQTCSLRNLTVPPVPGVNLMMDITEKGYLTNAGRWSLSHSGTDYDEDQNGTFWYAAKGNRTPEIYGIQSVWAFYVQPSEVRWIKCNVGDYTGLDYWRITGEINFDKNTPVYPFGPGGGAFFQILDANGDAILNLYEWSDDFKENTEIRFNDVVLWTMTFKEREQTTRKDLPFEIIHDDGLLTLNYTGRTINTTGVATVGADKGNPKTIQLTFNPGNDGRAIGVSKLVFYDE